MNDVLVSLRVLRCGHWFLNTMVGTRRSRTELPEIVVSVRGEERKMRNKEAVVVLDDEKGSQGCVITMEIAKLRERWELASVLNFLNVRI